MNGKVRRSFCFLFLSGVFCWTGCASVLSGVTQNIEINSNVPAVEVYADGQYLGSTPLQIFLPRQAQKKLRLEKRGYQSRVLTLRTRTNGEVWWNLPFTVLGVTGISTDYGSGAIYEYSPHRYYVSMKALKTSEAAEQEDDFAFINKNNLNKEKSRHQEGEFSRAEKYLRTFRE
jgi:hypothetical protein